MALSGSFSGSIASGKYTLRVDWSATQNVANNTSKITCAMYLVQASGWSLAISGRSDNSTTIAGVSTTWASPAFNNSGGKTTKMATVTSGNITHNDDGTKQVTLSATFYFRASISGTYYEKITASQTVTLDQIPRATTPILSASSVDMGGTVTISMPRASSDFNHGLYYMFAGTRTPIKSSGVGTSYTWTVPDLAAFLPNAASGVLTIICETYDNGGLLGSKSVTLTAKVPASVVPTVGTVTVSEAVANLASQFGGYVQNKSQVKANITASGAKGSTITEYSATLLGRTYTGSSWTSAVLTGSGDQTLSVKVKDSRGRWSAAKPVTVSILPYSEPKLSHFKVYRVNSSGAPATDGNRVAVVYGYEVAGVNSKNTASMVVDYKRSTATSYASTDKILTGTALSADTTAMPTTPTLSTDYQYDVRITVTDWFGASRSLVTRLPSGAVILDLSADGLGLSFGKTCDRPGIDFGWDAKGRVLGLGAAMASIPSGADLNAYYYLGVYSIANNAVAETLLNRPVSRGGTLRVFNGTGHGYDQNTVLGGLVYLVQEYRTYYVQDPTYRRTLTRSATGTWTYGAWVSSGATATVATLGTATVG